jgi:hypothetical protein
VRAKGYDLGEVRHDCGHNRYDRRLFVEAFKTRDDVAGNKPFKNGIEDLHIFRRKRMKSQNVDTAE